MKLFVKKCLLFTVVGLFIAFATYNVANYAAKRHLSNIILDPTVESVFAGDSHIQMGICDSLIPNSINIGSESESIYFTYHKLSVLLENNTAVKRIILGLGTHSISGSYDDYTFGVHSVSVAPKHYFLLPSKDQMKMLRHNFSVIHKFLRSASHFAYDLVVSKEFNPFANRFKKFNFIYAPTDSSIQKRIHNQFYSENELLDFSSTNIEYLKKIVELCLNKNVQLIALIFPTHPDYERKVPTEYKVKINEIIQENRLMNINLSHLVLEDDCFLPDGDHTTFKGALAISSALLDALENKQQ